MSELTVQTQVRRYEGSGTIYIDPEHRVVKVQIVNPSAATCTVFMVADGNVSQGVQLSKLAQWEHPIVLETAGPGGALLVRNEKIIYECATGGFLVLLLDVLVGE